MSERGNWKKGHESLKKRVAFDRDDLEIWHHADGTITRPDGTKIANYADKRRYPNRGQTRSSPYGTFGGHRVTFRNNASYRAPPPPDIDFATATYTGTDPDIITDAHYNPFQSRNKNLAGRLKPVPRTHALESLLRNGNIEEVCAEAMHFINGAVQSRYNGGTMSDDLQMCDCDGTVPICFMRAYLHERMMRLRMECRVREYIKHEKSKGNM